MPNAPVARKIYKSPKYRPKETKSLIVEISGLAITAGSIFIFVRINGSEAPINLEITIVKNKVIATIVLRTNQVETPVAIPCGLSGGISTIWTANKNIIQPKAKPPTIRPIKIAAKVSLPTIRQ